MFQLLSKLRRDQSGNAMVESALVLIVLLTTTIFVIDMGRMLLMEQFITERARQTARKAAVSNWSPTQVKNYLVYGTASSETLTAPGRLGLLPSQVSYQTLGTAGTPNHRVQVRVSGVQALLFIPRLSGSFALPTVVATVPAQSLGANN